MYMDIKLVWLSMELRLTGFFFFFSLSCVILVLGLV